MTKYTIKAGDTFFAIAKRLGISVDALQAGVNATALEVGQVINLPSAGGQQPPDQHPTGRIPGSTGGTKGGGVYV